MMERPETVHLQWHGPFRWPGIARDGRSDDLEAADVAARGGVYLWTVEHVGGFLIYAAGITRRPFRRRFMEHTRAYRSGVYTVFDAASLMQGVRVKVWPGFWFRKREPEMQRDYERRKVEVGQAVADLLAAYRVFMAPLSPVPRLLERIEAGIMSTLYAAGGVASEVPDRGMALAPRWPGEPVLLVKSSTAILLHGLSKEFEA